MRMAFPSSIPSISSAVAVVVLVAATTAVAQTRTSSFPAVGAAVTGNATVAAANGTTVKSGYHAAAAVSSSAAANDDYYKNRYICYLCYRRNTMMIKWCPLDKDHCHIACLSSPSFSSSSRRALQPPGLDGRALEVPGGRLPGPEDCYVMKLYPDGSWVIVDVVDCYAVAGCQLVCGYADAIAGREEDDSGAATARRRRLPPPRVADFERCGDQMGPLSAAVPGV